MKRTRMPLYAILKSDVINKIASGELRRGAKLPSERELAARLGVSRITVVGALRELEAEGVVVKCHGRGSFVAKEAFAEDYENIFTHTASGQETEITFGMFRPTPQYRWLVKTLANLFQLENPKIKVTPVDVLPPPDMAADAFLLRLAAGTVPTTAEFFMHADYAAVDALEPLETMPGFPELAAALHPKCVYETLDSGGALHVHALATKLNSRVVLVNARLLREAGGDPDGGLWNWEVLADWAARLGRLAGRHGLFVGLPEGWHNIIGLLPCLWGSGAAWPNSAEGFAAMLGSDTAAAGLGALSRLLAAGGRDAPANGLDLFAVGKVGLVLSGATWPLALLEQMSDQFEVKALPIPNPGGGGPPPSVVGNFSVGIFKPAVKSELELEAAWQWLRFLFRTKQQFTLTTDLNFPALKNLPSQLERSHPEAGAVFKAALDGGRPQFDFKDVRAALNAFGPELRRCLLGGRP